MADDTTTAEVDQSEVTQSLQDLEQEWVDREMETMFGTASQADDEQGVEGSDDADNVQDAADESQADVSNKAPGIDTALKYLDDNNSDLAGVVRAQIRDNQALRERQKSIEENLEDAVNTAVQSALAQQQPEEEEGGGYTPDQIEQAKQVLRSMGAVFKEDVEEKEKKDSLREYLDGALTSGIEAFGEMFGRVEDGKPSISEGALERIQAENKRIQQYGTLHATDLFKLSHFDELMEQAEERGRRTAGANIQQRTKKLNGATTATTTAPETPLPNLRGKSKKDDSIREVVMRSMVEARKKLGIS